MIRKAAQYAVLGIYAAAWAVSLMTVICRSASERWDVPLALTGAFLLTLGICSVPELAQLWSLIAYGKKKLPEGGEDEPK